MEATVFNRFRQIVYERSGITLGPQKEALVSSRVGKRMRALGLSDYGDYLRCLDEDVSGEEYIHLIDAISTNVTSFFREPQHFEFLSGLLQQWMAAGQRRFRLWSAASSSGEEPYSMAATALETLGRQSADIKILATDISTKVLRQCMKGVYRADKFSTVSPEVRERYFEPVMQGDELGYSVKPALRNITVFRSLNLSRPPFPMKGPLDAVFCRNVMIYFDNNVRKGLLDEIYRLLRPGGYLMVGHAESLTGMVSNFKSVRPSIYTKPD